MKRLFYKLVGMTKGEVDTVKRADSILHTFTNPNTAMNSAMAYIRKYGN